MLSEKMQGELSKQINAELYSAYLYLAIAAYFEETALKGCSHWMRIQFDEEMMHALKIFDYVHERGGRVILENIAKPEIELDSPLAAFEFVLEHEQKVTRLINDLVDVALGERDHATHNFLQWFIGEQVEEEASVDEIVQQLRMIGDSRNGLFMLDRHLAERPAAGEGAEPVAE